jgi:hypothetical protein
VDDNLNAIAFNAAYWGFCLFGFPANCLIAWRLHKREGASRDSSNGASDAFGPLSLTQQIKVRLVANLFFDDADALQDIYRD